jgi:hypothetical protein
MNPRPATLPAPAVVFNVAILIFDAELFTSSFASEVVVLTRRLEPLKVRFASPFKLLPLPPVMTLSSALLVIVAEPAAPW